MATPTRTSRRVDRRTKQGRTDPIPSRERLLRAAAKVFAERGFEGASVDEIAAEAGLSKGTLYWNFKSKDDLFEALLEEHIDRRTRAVISLAGSASAEEDMAPEASRWFSELLRDEREFLLLSHEYWARAVRDPALRAQYAARRAERRAALAEALEARGRELGAPPLSLSTDEAATAFIALGEGLGFQQLLDPGSVAEDLYGEILALVFQGLVARAERDRQSAAEAERP